ncbi:MAG: hypothetical protein ACOYMN_01990 [Roseimicrobium sp.]
MKAPLLFAVVLLSAHAVLAVPRNFTSTDGKTISAELVTANSLQATLKLASGQESVVPLNRLSKADQDFITAWLKQSPQAAQAIRYNFEVDASKEKLDTKKTRTGSSVINATTSEWLYHVKITNRASQLIEGLQMRFQIHYNDVDGKTKSTELKSGAKAVPALKPGESTVVDTDTV